MCLGLAGQSRSDDQVGDPIAVHISGARDRKPALVIMRCAVDTEPFVPSSDPRFMLFGKPEFLPNTTNVDPAANSPLGLALGAPTIRSAIPSPFTSLALATESPLQSPASAPLMRTPSQP